MTRIAIIGAGSTIFMRNVVGDVLLTQSLRDCEIALMDLDEVRLKTSGICARKLAEAAAANPKISVTTDRREALRGADFVIVMIQVAGYRPGTVIDFEVPKQFGLRQTIGDTLGVGGIMRGLRTVPVLLSIAEDMREFCPTAIMLQYVNPMAINCWALSRLTPDITCVGLCHSVQETAQELADDLGEEVSSIRYLCAGINHLSFYLNFKKIGANGNMEDLYPRLRELADKQAYPQANSVRYEMLRRTGYFLTESSEHFSEYVPWFIKRDRPDLIEKYHIPLDEYPRRCEEQISGWKEMEAQLVGNGTIAHSPSREYAARIMNAVVTGEPLVVNGNVRNDGLIENLPADACVEVPCVVDHNGISPSRIGRLPVHLAALMQTNINVQSCVVEALATGRREHIHHAAMLDPHTAAELDLEQTWDLVDKLIDAHAAWLPANLVK